VLTVPSLLACFLRSQYLAELLAEHQKLGPFMQVLPVCSRLLNQGELFFFLIPRLLTVACRLVANPVRFKLRGGFSAIEIGESPGFNARVAADLFLQLLCWWGIVELPSRHLDLSSLA
jgi:hypothetical protein